MEKENCDNCKYASHKCMKRQNGKLYIFYCEKYEKMYRKIHKCRCYQKMSNHDTNLHVNDAARQDPEARDKGIHQDA